MEEAEEEVAWMENRAQGVEVPTPTLPWESITKAVVVELVVEESTVETAKSGTVESEEVADTDRRAKGEVVATPNFPER